MTQPPGLRIESIESEQGTSVVVRSPDGSVAASSSVRFSASSRMFGPADARPPHRMGEFEVQGERWCFEQWNGIALSRSGRRVVLYRPECPLPSDGFVVVSGQPLKKLTPTDGEFYVSEDGCGRAVVRLSESDEAIGWINRRTWAVTDDDHREPLLALLKAMNVRAITRFPPLFFL